MKEKIEKLQDLLLGKEISHKTKFSIKTYNVKTVVERASRIVIETIEGKTFTETLDTIEFLLNDIKVIGVSNDNNDVVSNFKETAFVVKNAQFVAPESTNSVSEGLMSIFQKLTANESISDSDLKTAKLACDVAGKIIDIEKVKLGYLGLNYR